ncbi:MAG: BamA/TamA family outer membrane protein [Candidatus Eremiobacteraeota bacterium]|nr:BamA/TamA family outer membrane protein [Candidatus Eremiobacteraeota bacterium]
MTSSLRRARGALVRCAGLLLAVAFLTTLVSPVPAYSATAPIIASVDVSGNVHVPTDKILAVVQAKPGLPYDPKVVQGDLQRIFALGYFADQATPLIRQRPNGIAITYRVIENPVITKIAFTGNAHVPSDTLLALMDTSVGQVLDTETLKQDFLKINSYYERIGYRGQLPTHVKDLNIDPKTGALTIAIQEGLTIAKVTVAGDPLLPPSVTLPALGAKPGVVYSDDLRDKDFQTANKLYDKYNLVLASADGGIDPSTIDLKAGTADVKYDFYVARVGVVQITGNTKTKDQVIRRELRLRPGMVITTDGLRNDRDRLNNTGYFSKVDLNVKDGPDPKNHPGYVTIVWTVTEQRTASASVGAGYSGGITGEGLYGTLGYQDNNLHGTGNGASVQFQRGARSYITQASVTIPYVGNTPQSQKYSVGASIFANGSTYFYPVYSVANTAPNPAPGATQAPIPVTLLPNGNAQLINGIVSNSTAKSSGVSFNVGRRLTDFIRASVGVNAESVTNVTNVPPPYFFQSGQPNVIAGPTPGPLSNLTSNQNGSFGINATSIANINTGAPYRLNSVVFGLSTNPAATLDDIFNPHRGGTASLSEEFSSPSIGSNFRYTKTTVDATRFIPVKKATLGLHGLAGMTTGAIPPSALFTFSDQQLRGYQSVFYGTDEVLGQAELRVPLTPDGKFGVAAFVDEGGFRVRGAQPLVDPYTNRIINYPGNWAYRGDYGVGLRFDVPQLGLHTIRIDIARGANGTHTSFGIGQSF